MLGHSHEHHIEFLSRVSTKWRCLRTHALKWCMAWHHGKLLKLAHTHTDTAKTYRMCIHILLFTYILVVSMCPPYMCVYCLYIYTHIHTYIYIYYSHTRAHIYACTGKNVTCTLCLRERVHKPAR